MKKAFTLLELVFVILIVGILASVMIPSYQSSSLRQAAIQLQSDIRYTQHLAMMDDRYNSDNTKWFKERWVLYFTHSNESDSKYAYTIFSDTDGTSTGDADENEIAKNPNNKAQLMTGGCGSGSRDIRSNNFKGMEKLNLGKSYDITNVTFSSSCTFHTSKRLYFDHLGRPIKGKLGKSSGDKGNKTSYESDNLIKSECILTLQNSNGDTISLSIMPETGYVKIN